MAEVTASWLSAPDLSARIEAADAVVYATGAQEVAARVRASVPCFEFRHAPDPAALVEGLVPRLAALRRARLASNREAPPGPGASAAAATTT